MFKIAQLTVVLLSLAVFPDQSWADLVLKYEGQPFTSFFGDGAFTSRDHITALVTFDSIGATKAKALSLSVTMDGDTGLTFSVPNAKSSLSFVVERNRFSEWQNSLPVQWHLEVVGSMYGSADADEVLSILHEVVQGEYISEDFASVDIYDDGEYSALSFSQGTWSVVPEPSSFCPAGIAFGFALLGMWRGRRKPAA